MFLPRVLTRLVVSVAAAGLAWCPLEGHAEPTGKVVTLEQAYDLTLSSDQSIRVAYLEARKARLLPWSALTRMGPEISVGGSYDRSERSVTRPVTISDALLGTESTNRATTRSRSGVAEATFSVNQPLIDFTVFAAYRGAKISEESARLQHRFTVRGTLYGVAQAYYDVLEQQRLVEVNRETLRLSKEQLSLAETRANVGEVTRSDVLRAQVTFQTARRTLIESENVLESRYNTLGNILNFAPGTPFRVAEPPNYPTTRPPFAELFAKAMEHREDLRVAKLAIQKDEERRKEILGQYGPTLSARFNAGLGNQSGSEKSRDHDWLAALSVNVPIFNGGQREIDLATQKLQIEQTRLDFETATKNVEQEVKDAWLVVRSLEETLKALKAQVDAANQGYLDLQNQYRAGTATSVDVLTALNDLNTARKDLAVETYAYQIALRNLEQVTGTFQETRVQQLKVR